MWKELPCYDEETVHQTNTRKDNEGMDEGEQESHQHEWISVVVALSNCLMIVNSSINFYIYYGKYRKHLPKNRWSSSHVRTQRFSQPRPMSSTRLNTTQKESKNEDRSMRLNFD